MRCRLSPTADVPSHTSGAASGHLRGHSITSSHNTIDGGTVSAGALAVLAFSAVTCLYWQVSFAR
jgi:hypothetical protein